MKEKCIFNERKCGLALEWDGWLLWTRILVNVFGPSFQWISEVLAKNGIWILTSCTYTLNSLKLSSWNWKYIIGGEISMLLLVSHCVFFIVLSCHDCCNIGKNINYE